MTNKNIEMNIKIHFQELMCCVSEVPSHFIQDAKPLSCGHYVCAKCIISPIDLMCGLCSQLNKLDLNAMPVIKLAENYIERHLREFSRYLYDRMVNVENDIKGK